MHDPTRTDAASNGSSASELDARPDLGDVDYDGEDPPAPPDPPPGDPDYPPPGQTGRNAGHGDLDYDGEDPPKPDDPPPGDPSYPPPGQG